MAQPAIDITALGELSACCMHSLRETEWAFDQLIHKRLDGMDGEIGIDREVVEHIRSAWETMYPNFQILASETETLLKIIQNIQFMAEFDI